MLLSGGEAQLQAGTVAAQLCKSQLPRLVLYRRAERAWERTRADSFGFLKDWGPTQWSGSVACFASVPFFQFSCSRLELLIELCREQLLSLVVFLCCCHLPCDFWQTRDVGTEDVDVVKFKGLEHAS